MKRIIGLLALVALLAAPSFSFAEGSAKKGGAGLYIAPRVGLAATTMNKFGVEGLEDPISGGFLGIEDKSDTGYFGSLAIGYDFGRRSNLPMRLEVEYAMFSSLVSEEPLFDSRLTWTFGGNPINFGVRQKLEIQAFFVNAYYDVRRDDTDFSFWFGGGVGMASIDSKGSNFSIYAPNAIPPFPAGYGELYSSGSKKKTNIAWNVALGVGYDITDNLTFDLGYRFVWLGKAETQKSNGTFNSFWGFPDHSAKIKDVFMHQCLLGLRFTF